VIRYSQKSATSNPNGKDCGAIGAHLPCVSCSLARSWRLCKDRRHARPRVPPGTAPSGEIQPCPAVLAEWRWGCRALHTRNASQYSAAATAAVYLVSMQHANLGCSHQLCAGQRPWAGSSRCAVHGVQCMVHAGAGIRRRAQLGCETMALESKHANATGDRGLSVASAPWAVGSACSSCLLRLTWDRHMLRFDNVCRYCVRDGMVIMASGEQPTGLSATTINATGINRTDSEGFPMLRHG